MTLTRVTNDLIAYIPVNDLPNTAMQWILGASAKGINLDGYESGNIAGYGPVPTEADMIKLSNAGVDTVRIPINWSSHSSQNVAGIIVGSYFTTIDGVINLALKYFNRVIINMHHYHVLDAAGLEGGETYWSGTPSQANTIQISYTAAPYRTNATNIWNQIATRYANSSPRLSFELYNEPTYPFMDWPDYNLWFANTVSSIRSTGGVNAYRTIIYNTVNMASPSSVNVIPVANNSFALNNANNILDANTAIAFHPYAPANYTQQGAYGFTYPINAFKYGQWVISATWAQHRAMYKWSLNHGYPVINTEVGVMWQDTGNPQGINTAHDRARYIRMVRETCTSFGIPWTAWSHASDYAILDESFLGTGGDWLPGMKSALTGNPSGTSTPPLQTSLAHVPSLTSFTPALGPLVTWDQSAQEMTFVGSTTAVDYVAICDSIPLQNTTYQLANGGWGNQSLKLTYFTNYANVATRQADSSDCSPGSVITYTIPNTTVPANARFALVFSNDDYAAPGSTLPHVTIVGV